MKAALLYFMNQIKIHILKMSDFDLYHVLKKERTFQNAGMVPVFSSSKLQVFIHKEEQKVVYTSY